ncbi:MAG: 2-succinyl-5-enolpyruvyl-6-hydroxy-3-cyclohexene-1-carboxylic-acid synthase, partial [Clostridia bacterium]|nr:2-succinyl-5-enolpyruvyl-6-hydroxy-3-cyclohexene-1-carboxylic-acid synthase [Clostridia bacterium]
MYANNLLVLELIALLKKFGIKKIVVSPGSRHRPFVASLEQDSYFELYSVVDERGAAFFALGLIQETQEPVAITCSSGTACMNYGSAVVEAYYQRLPLLVLSSDRNPCLLNQGEDQMYSQVSTFVDCTKYHAQLPIINNQTDQWYCNRLINEGLIALTSHGRGPVHLNFPVVSHHGDSLSIDKLPEVRKIEYHTLTYKLPWSLIADRLKNKKIVIVWGQSVVQDGILREAIDKFILKSGAVILTDKMSNCQSKYALRNTLLALNTLLPSEKLSLMPDIVISIGGNYI